MTNPETLADQLANEIEASEGIYLMGVRRQMGIKKTAQVIAALRAQPAPSQAVLDELAELGRLAYDSNVSAEAIGIRLRNTWSLWEQTAFSAAPAPDGGAVREAAIFAALYGEDDGRFLDAAELVNKYRAIKSKEAQFIALCITEWMKPIVPPDRGGTQIQSSDGGVEGHAAGVVPVKPVHAIGSEDVLGNRTNGSQAGIKPGPSDSIPDRQPDQGKSARIASIIAKFPRWRDRFKTQAERGNPFVGYEPEWREIKDLMDEVESLFATPPRPEASGETQRWRHLKRSTTYRLLFEATMQMAGFADDQPVVVYQAELDGRKWVRPSSEFYDGRFEAISPSPDAKSEMEKFVEYVATESSQSLIRERAREILTRKQGG